MDKDVESPRWFAGREIKLITWVVMLSMGYSLVSVGYNVFDTFIAPRLDTGSRQMALPWPFVLTSVSALAFDLALNLLALRALRCRTAADWRFVAALFAFALLGMMPVIASSLMVRLPPDGSPLLFSRPSIPIRLAANFLVATGALVLVSRPAVLASFGIGVDQRKKRLLSAFGLGFLFLTASVLLTMLSSRLAILMIE